MLYRTMKESVNAFTYSLSATESLADSNRSRRTRFSQETGIREAGLIDSSILKAAC